MSLRLQIIIIICMLCVMLYIINLVRKKRIDLRYALGWIIVDLLIVMLSIWPSILEKLSKILGIASPMNMLFFFGFCFSVVIIFSLSMAISHLSDKVKKMAQEIAIMRKDMYDIQNRE